METRRIGSLKVPVVGLGCNNFGRRLDERRTKAVVEAALEAGVTLLDTADAYGDGMSERYLGTALGSHRDDVVIATKFGSQIGGDPDRSGARPQWVRQAVEDSLRRLGTDRIDLYQQHVPDDATPLEDTLAELDRLVELGKVREVGCSNFEAGRINRAAGVAAQRGLAGFVSVQNQYSLLHREPEAEVIEACHRHDLAFLPYFPLASGVLTGKYRRGQSPPEGSRLAGMPAERAGRFLNDRNLRVVEDLEAFCMRRGRSLLELAFSWLLARPVVASVIAGATKPEQVRANAAAGGWQLSEEELEEVDRIAG